MASFAMASSPIQNLSRRLLSHKRLPLPFAARALSRCSYKRSTASMAGKEQSHSCLWRMAPHTLGCQCQAHWSATRVLCSLAPFPSLVSPMWLHSRLKDSSESIKVLDGSWYLPAEERNPLEEFKKEHIPGATFFDIDRVADQETDLPHMLPPAHVFSAVAAALGVTPETSVVVYDGMGMFSAPRVWWTFKVFGHSRVAVLDGGLPAWKREGYSVDMSMVDDNIANISVAAAATASDESEPQYPTRLDSLQVRGIDAMLKNIESRNEQVVDARGAGRFKGTAPEIRPGMRSGHIPGSHNVCYHDVLTNEGRMKSADGLNAVFASAGVDIKKPMVMTCGSGVTASILALAAEQLGAEKVAVYDGSWSEWGGRQDTPVATDT